MRRQDLLMVMRQDASTGQLVEDASAASGPGSTAKAAHDHLIVKVWSPFKVYFDGEAKSVSGADATGPFDVLPKHRNFIALLSACELRLRTLAGDVRIRISGGVIQVHQDIVTVFLEV